MKFQNPSIHHSKVNRRTDRQTDKPKAICPSNFFKVGGINMLKVHVYQVSLKYSVWDCTINQISALQVITAIVRRGMISSAKLYNHYYCTLSFYKMICTPGSLH